MLFLSFLSRPSGFLINSESQNAIHSRDKSLDSKMTLLLLLVSVACFLSGGQARSAGVREECPDDDVDRVVRGYMGYG